MVVIKTERVTQASKCSKCKSQKLARTEMDACHTNEEVQWVRSRIHNSTKWHLEMLITARSQSNRDQERVEWSCSMNKTRAQVITTNPARIQIGGNKTKHKTRTKDLTHRMRCIFKTNNSSCLTWSISRTTWTLPTVVRISNSPIQP